MCVWAAAWAMQGGSPSDGVASSSSSSQQRRILGEVTRQPGQGAGAVSRRVLAGSGACTDCFSLESAVVPLGYQLALTLPADVKADMWLLPDQASFDACDFTSASPYSKGIIDTSQPFLFQPFARTGTYYFASSMPSKTRRQCKDGLKLMVLVTDAAVTGTGSLPDKPTSCWQQGGPCTGAGPL